MQSITRGLTQTSKRLASKSLLATSSINSTSSSSSSSSSFSFNTSSSLSSLSSLSKTFINNNNNNQTIFKSLYSNNNGGRDENIDFQNTVEISGLPSTITKHDIQDLFPGLSISHNGIKMIFDDETNLGYAYVTFDTQSDRLGALQIRDANIGSVKVNILPLSINKKDWKDIGSSSYLHRTAVTNHLWRSRTPLFELKSKTINHPPSNKTIPIVEKSPQDSFTEIFLHFSSDINLREMYLSPFGHLRIGRFLEDLDALAGTVAYKHAEGTSEEKLFTIVTACVDRIHLLRPLCPDKDFKMEGIVTWVGKSSMEIMIKVRSMDPATKVWEPVLISYFTMVALNPENRKAAPVNQLVLDTEKQRKLFEDGELHKQQRLSHSQQSLQTSPPTDAELKTIHDLFMTSNQPQQFEKTQWIPMKNTNQTTVILCQPQERNMHGNIFGGYLMRKGFELAFTTCFVRFNKSIPQFFAMDDITFLQSVDIGNILSMDATIVYVHPIPDLKESYYVQVEVTAHVSNPIKSGPEKKRSNTFNFTFLCTPPDSSTNYSTTAQQPEKQGSGDIPKPIRILPQTYTEAMRYLAGKRIVDRQKLYSQSDLDVWRE